jgi:LmbE family N-acetylglucosaminyl deacetylase
VSEEKEARTSPVLACFAHPDDAELAAGGVLAKWAEQGREVHLLVLTNGDRGSDKVGEDREALAATRVLEQEAAGRVLGLAGFGILDASDGELENIPAVRAAVARRIREVRPDVVVGNDPTTWFIGNRYVNHADHRTAGAVVIDSVFPGAGNPLFFTEQLEEGLEPWSVRELWLAWTLEPNHYEDVTGYLERKVDALAEHASQVQGDMMKFFREWLPREAEEQGRKIGVQHAESFRRLTLD